MNEEIEKIKDCIDSVYGCDCAYYGVEGMAIAQALYNAGYRKQSEVIEEYRKKVYSKMEKYTVFGREYIQRIMREAEKEMKGGE